MIITRIEIDGFKSFVGFELDLKPFTVLAGPNNSGKSNLLEAIELLRNISVMGTDNQLVYRSRGTGVELFHRSDDGTPRTSFTISADVQVPEPGASRSFNVAFVSEIEGGRLSSHFMDIKPAVDFFEHQVPLLLTAWISVNPEAARMRHGASLDDRYPLAGSGANLAAVIGRILEQEGAEEFVLDAQYVIGDLKSLSPIRDERRNQWDFDIVMRGSRTFTPALVSDGTLRVLALLAALHDPDHRGVVMIEDLENGLHPEYQGRLCDRLAARTADSGRQVIATTHSPVVVSATLEQQQSAVVFLDQVAGPADEDEGDRRAQHRTRARRIADGGERGTYVTPAELEKYLATSGGR
jgi:predicted ATPase